MLSARRRDNALAFATGVAALIIGLSFGAFFFGSLVHESSHAIACLIFGLKYSWSPTQVIYAVSPDPFVNLVVRLAGGFGQAFFSLVFLILLIKIEEPLIQNTSERARFVARPIFFGFELGFLTIGLQGFVNGIWEGFFFENYGQTHGDILLWGVITLICGIASLIMFHYRKRIVFSYWKTILELATWGEEYRGDFIAGFIAFLVPFLISWGVQGFFNATTVASFFGTIAVLIPLVLGHYRLSRFAVLHFRKIKYQQPIRIGVLNGQIGGESNPLPPLKYFTDIDPSKWHDMFLSIPEFSVGWISATEISEECDFIINPFGEIYPETDKGNLSTLRRIVRYVQEGGVFVNVAGFAFFYSWDGRTEDLTGPLYETYEIKSVPGVLRRTVLLRSSDLLDQWLFRKFGIRNTFFSPTIIPVRSVTDEYFQGLEKVGNDKSVQEFRSAYRSEVDRAELIPLLRAEYMILVVDEKGGSTGSIPFECYPIAAVKYGKGYLILSGMKLENARPQDFQKVVEVIIRAARKLNQIGEI